MNSILTVVVLAAVSISNMDAQLLPLRIPPLPFGLLPLGLGNLGAQRPQPLPFNASCPVTTPAQNKRIAIDFFDTILNKQDFSQIDRFMTENSIEHNPDELDGRDEFKARIAGQLSQTPKGSLVIAQSAADGDLVWLHSRLPIQGNNYTLADIFRIECGKIAEHWDVVQQMVSPTVSPHPYF